jgi:hypothetical protein
MASDMLSLQDLYNEALVRELIEKTKTCGLVWNHLGGTQFQATEIQSATPDPDITWDIFVTKTQIGNATFKYTLDIKQDAVAYISLNDGPLPFTERDSVVKELYDTVELIVLEMDSKVKETLRFVQGITDCRS